MNRPVVVASLLLAFLGILTACSRLPEPALPTMAPTEVGPGALPSPTPPPIHTDLIVCLAQEPSTLYLYGDTTREADTILEAIYDGPTAFLGFKDHAVILDGLPTFANGGAHFEKVSLRSGDVYLNPETDKPDTLNSGSPYLPSGCTQTSCLQSYQSGSVDMDRLVVDFKLKPGLTWSDGEPLTVADSVFSYQLDGDLDTPSTKYLFDRTFSYKAVDDLTVEWVGLAGFVDPDYQANFWSPLPKHTLGAMTAAQVLASDLAARKPLGWGPYEIQNWAAGEQIVLTPNPAYWQESGAGKPFERLIFRFLGDQADSAIDQLETGECDMLDETLLAPGDIPQLETARSSGDLDFKTEPGVLVMRLDMNLDPAANGQPGGLFSDVRTRRGLSLCIDREAIVDEVLNGSGVVTDSYLPPLDPLYSASSPPQTYDPAAGQTLLDAAGWRAASSGTGPRVAQAVPDVPDGTPLRFEILSPSGDEYDQLGALLKSDLASCGVGVDLRTMSPAELFASWPDGPVFGRTFQAVLWSWPTLGSPACDMFAGWEVPADGHPLGINASGFANSAYDSACRQALWSVPDSPSYAEAVRQTQSILQDQLPGIPLFVRPRLVAYAPWLCGVELDPSSASDLWNLESLEACSPGG